MRKHDPYDDKDVSKKGKLTYISWFWHRQTTCRKWQTLT